MKRVKNKIVRKHGFTLIEILLVMLITSILVLGVNITFRQGHMLWSRIESERSVYQKSRIVFDTIRQELACLYLPNGTQDKPLTPFSLSSLSDGTTQFSFYTLNPVWNGTTMSNFPAKVDYIFTVDSNSGVKCLSRAEQLCSGQIPIVSQKKQIILSNLSEFKVWVVVPNSDFNSDSWQDNLECKLKPPKAVKILIKWSNDDNKEFEFQTIIKVICQYQITP